MKPSEEPGKVFHYQKLVDEKLAEPMITANYGLAYPRMDTQLPDMVDFILQFSHQLNL